MKKNDNKINFHQYIFLCNNKDCSCHDILKDDNKINEIIIKKEKYICFKYYIQNFSK